MAQIPFHLRYTLSRAQRLGSLVRMWGVGFSLAGAAFCLFFLVMLIGCVLELAWTGIAVFGGLLLFAIAFNRDIVLGILDVVLVSRQAMDVIVEENAAGILIGDQRWYLFLDGITDLRKFRDDTWTIQHFNGFVLHIAASAIQEDQIAHSPAALERARTPEGIQAVDGPGKRS